MDEFDAVHEEWFIRREEAILQQLFPDGMEIDDHIDVRAAWEEFKILARERGVCID